MRMTLRQVFDSFDRVVIPLLQRDYAHGRASVGDVRTRFLEVLHKQLTLPEQERGEPLDLDFIYGSVHASSNGTDDAQRGGELEPLDGQQRLTTLFLLHWYLALLDDRFDDFASWAHTSTGTRGSMLSYRVRPSSTDFFDALLEHGRELEPAHLTTSMSAVIENKPWFYLSWKFDPTICSALRVLDDIHGIFKETSGGYARLTDEAHPAITFQFLNLEQFHLNEDLYIKMNARGKALTRYETFKANLQGEVPQLLPDESYELGGTQVSAETYIGQRFDTRWCDFFWGFRDDEHDFDEMIMTMVRAVALVGLVVKGDFSDPEALQESLDALRKGELRTFHDLEDAGCIHGVFLKTLIALFDRWSDARQDDDTSCFGTDTSYYDASAVFERFLRSDTEGKRGLPYDEWVQFVGWCLFLLDDTLELELLDEWMRVVCNLARNTTYNRVSEFMASLQTLPSMLDDVREGLLDAIATGPPRSGFNRQQWREERLKAQLLLHDHDAWWPLIHQAETHAYFAGQIEFLFAFSGVLERWLADDKTIIWSDDEDQAFREAFAMYSARSAVIFEEGKTSPFADFLLERALLCVGDYLLSNRNNACFLFGSHRELSWKRYLRADSGNAQLTAKRDHLRVVLDALDPEDPEASLTSFIETSLKKDSEDEEVLIEPWRRCLVEKPILIGYCRKRQIRIVPGEAIYLLTKTRRSGYHQELFTGYHYKGELAKLARSGGFGPLTWCKYIWRVTDAELPGIWLSTSKEDKEGCMITRVGDVFVLDVPERLREDSEHPLEVASEDLIETLEALGERWLAPTPA